jgi:drug/metabolite transporter (DMT)-like permease
MNTSNTKTKAYLGLAAICIIWGTTYTAIKFGVRDFQPYLMVGIRQSFGGILLLVWAFFSGKITRLSTKYLAIQAIAGVLMITGGNGFITWGMQFVSSGLSSVISSITPVLIVILTLLMNGSEKINRLIILGVLLGFGGLGLIFREGWADFANPVYQKGIFACLSGCVAWALGTVISKKYNDKDISLIFTSGLQLLAGGLMAFILSIFFDKNHTLPQSWQPWAAITYLALIGSALAFSIYLYVLKHLSATVSSLYTYINPIVAIALGAIFLGEKFTWTEAIGMSVTLLGVYLVNIGNQKSLK